MIVHVSRPSGYATNLSRQLVWVAKLYRARYLDASSSVWLNANIDDPLFWVFTDRPAAIWWHEAPTAGFVRLSTGRARWGLTSRSAGREPSLDLRPADRKLLSIGALPLTVVIDHLYTPAGAAGIGLIDGSATRTLAGGFYENSEFAVLDLPLFQPGPRPAPATIRDYNIGMATFHGIRLMEWGMSSDQTADLHAHPGHYQIDLTTEILDQLVEGLDRFTMVADWMTNALASNTATTGV